MEVKVNCRGELRKRSSSRSRDILDVEIRRQEERLQRVGVGSFLPFWVVGLKQSKLSKSPLLSVAKSVTCAKESFGIQFKQVIRQLHFPV